jgi:hypothetical protein
MIGDVHEDYLLNTSQDRAQLGYISLAQFRTPRHPEIIQLASLPQGCPVLACNGPSISAGWTRDAVAARQCAG